MQKQSVLEEKLQREGEERAEKRLVAEIEEDFFRRREDRRRLESGWLLNMNFFSGNQYCDISPNGGVEDEEKRYYWQSRRTFNHIAPAIEARLAKLESRKPVLKVRAFSDEEGDIQAAKLATALLRYAEERIGLPAVISRATVWSEICGCVFYKIRWNERGGRQVAVSEEGLPVYEGEAEVSIVPPFELFPDRLDIEDFDEAGSVVHAQTVSSDYIFERFGVEVKGERLRGVARYSEPSAGGPAESAQNAAVVENGVLLLERYTRPCGRFPRGKLEIVAGGRLLYAGDLPYENGNRGERGFPFVKQDSLRLPGAFFGGSVVDRLIPLQRAYNAVRNRKHEFLNRLSMGVLTVEDGSVDTDDLSEEGLLPGKVLVYRQGSKAPEMLDCGSIPAEFRGEEEWLEKEFALISGVSELTQSSTPLRVTSATGLQLLLSQDEMRLSATLACMERAVQEIGRQLLRLYRQFAGTARLMTMTGEGKRAQAYYFNASKLEVGDIQFEEGDRTSAEDKKAVILRLYEAGLFADEEGKISKENRQRILEAFGYGSYENARDISSLHIVKAGEENLALMQGEAEVDEYDDHALHTVEHTRFLLSEEFKRKGDREAKQRFLAHLANHKKSEEDRI